MRREKTDYGWIETDEGGNLTRRKITICGPDGDRDEIQVMTNDGNWIPQFG